MQHSEEPLSKKIATDGQVNVVSTDSSPSHIQSPSCMQWEATTPAPSSDSNVGPSTSSEQKPANHELDHKIKIENNIVEFNSKTQPLNEKYELNDNSEFDNSDKIEIDNINNINNNCGNVQEGISN